MLNMIKDKENKFKRLLNGNWIESANYIDIKSPLTGKVIGMVPAMSQEEVNEAIEGNKKAQKEWKNTTIDERSKILYKAAELLEREADALGELIMMEVAKDRKSAKSEVIRTADFIRFTADSAKSIQGESVSGDSFPGYNKNKVSMVSREPLGVVLAISPFNYPVNLAASKIAPAIVGGNAVAFKPATQGSLSGLYLAKIFEEAGVPAGVINTITGRGSEIGDYVVTHEGINFVNFTGSSAVGERIAQNVKMIPYLMELGGKDAAVVLKDADLDLATKNIVAGAYSYSGQRCTAIKRVLVVDEVADKLVEKIAEGIKNLKVGNPLEVDADIVPLIDSKSADFVQGLIDEAVKLGGKLVSGGQREGNLVYPTLIDYVTEDMRLAWEEPFGPVLPIIRVKDMEEAIKIANKSEYGLQSSVFTQNINDAFYVASKLEVGTVQVNNKTERGPDHFPFMGVKKSGVGAQGIRYSIEAMTRLKGTVINLSR